MIKTINIINVGCFKNLVDCEKLMYQLSASGFDVKFGAQEEHADIVIINTCGFISDAEKDSLDEIRKYAEKKRMKQIDQLWVMGCYSQKKGEKLKTKIPEIDNLYGNFDWQNILHDLGKTYICNNERILITPQHYAFIKISDGCNQACSYCVKPAVNGLLRSIPVDELVSECRTLVDKGVKEFHLVAQNLTAYGIDMYKEKRIAELVERISDIAGVEWIRLHYAYPAGFPVDLLRIIRERSNVCNYLDMAIQHCSTKMLKLMRRNMTKEALVDLIRQIRSEVPNIYIRTTVMTGHPCETETDFDELFAFISEQRFERLGVFSYSHEKGTWCYQHYIDDVPEEIKRQRAIRLIDLQKQKYMELNTSLIGTKQRVVIDKKIKEGYYVGRTEYSTPLADPATYLTSDANLQTGSFYEATITGVRGKDMEGIII